MQRLVYLPPDQYHTQPCLGSSPRNRENGKLSAFALAIASVPPTFASAATCTDGLTYCSFSLENNGMSWLLRL